MVVLILSFGDAVSKEVNREGGGDKQDKVAEAHAGEGPLAIQGRGSAKPFLTR